MKDLSALLYRDWLEFKKKYISYILIWFTLPMLIYLFMIIPFSFHISTVELMNYKNWASPGLWICSSGVLSFLCSYTKLKNLIYKKEYLDKYLKAPISNGQFLFSLMMFSVIIGLIQLIISILITTSLNNDNLDLVQLCLTLINVTTILFFTSLIGLLSAFYIKEDIFSTLLFLIIFIILFISLGTLVPIEVSYNKFSSLITSLPFYKIVLNIQFLYAGKSMMILPIFIMNLINVLLFVIIVAISYKKFRK